MLLWLWETHCSGRNPKEDEARSLIDKAMAAFQKWKMSPVPFSSFYQDDDFLVFQVLPALVWQHPIEAFLCCDGASFSSNDASSTWSWNEATHGRPCATSARAPAIRLPMSPWWYPLIQTGQGRGEPPENSSVTLLYQIVMLWTGRFLTEWQWTFAPLPLLFLSKRE